MKMTQTTDKYPKYDDNILAGTKSTKRKQVLKDNAKQTCYAIQMMNLIYRIQIPRKHQISVY